MDKLKAQANLIVAQTERIITERKAQRNQAHEILKEFLCELLANAETSRQVGEEEDTQMLAQAKGDLEAIEQCCDVVGKLHPGSSPAKRA